MDAAESYLNNYTFLSDSRRNAEKMLAEMISRKNEYIDSLLKSSFPTGVKVQHNPRTDMVVSAVADITEFYDNKISSLSKEIKKLYTSLFDADRFFDGCGLNRNERLYINMRYANHFTNICIARELHISERCVYNIRRSLISKIRKKIKGYN